MTVGLVLEGGGMRGMFTAGVLDALMEQHIQIDKIIGVSAGALFGINYASNQKERALRYNLKYLKDKRYMGFHSLFTTGNIVNKDFAFYDLPFNLDPFDQNEFEKYFLRFYEKTALFQKVFNRYAKLAFNAIVAYIDTNFKQAR